MQKNIYIKKLHCDKILHFIFPITYKLYIIPNNHQAVLLIKKKKKKTTKLLPPSPLPRIYFILFFIPLEVDYLSTIMALNNSSLCVERSFAVIVDDC
jgi:hypothetical protein